MAAVPTASARAFLLVRRKSTFFEDASKFFDRRFIFFLVLCCSSSEKTARFTFGSQFWNIFLSLFSVRGKCGTRRCALVEFVSRGGEIFEGFILGVVLLLFFQKEALSFPKGERTLLGFVRWRNF